MANTNTISDEINKAINEVEDQLQKATQSKELEHEKKESKEEEDDENDEYDEEDLDKAFNYLKKSGYDHEADESEKEEMIEEMAKKGHKKSVCKAAMKKFASSKLKKALGYESDDIKENVLDATSIIENLINSQDDIQKSLQNQNDSNMQILKSLAVFGKGLGYAINQLDKIANTPIQKGMIGAKAVQKSFDKVETNEDSKKDNKDVILKGLKQIAFSGNFNENAGLKVQNYAAANIYNQLLSATDFNPEIAQSYFSEIEKITGTKLS